MAASPPLKGLITTKAGPTERVNRTKIPFAGKICTSKSYCKTPSDCRFSFINILGILRTRMVSYVANEREKENILL